MKSAAPVNPAESFPPWLAPGLESAAPSQATLIAGAEGDGATIFAERLTLKFAGAEEERWNLQNCPDILAVRPELPKSKPEGEKTHYGVDSVRGGDEGGDEFGVGKTRRPGIVEFAGMRPKALPFRVVLIRRADRMNSQAANALLKTLEEPGRTTRFILTTPAVRLVLPTVASRCRVLPLPRPSAEQAAAWVRAAGGDSSDLAFFANRPLDAAEEEDKMRDQRRKVIGLFRAGKNLDIIAGIKELSGVPAVQWLEWLQKWTTDAVRVAMNLPPQFFPNDADALARLADGRGRAFLDLHAALARHRLLTQPLNATLLAADAVRHASHDRHGRPLNDMLLAVDVLDDYCQAAAGRFVADFSVWEF